MANSIEPLASSLWFQRIAVIAAGELGSIENSLRHASHLVQLAPKAFRQVLPPILDEKAFEELLDAGDLDTAARQLVSSPATLLIQASPDAKSLRAVIDCTILKRPVEGTGDTAAAAILDAWANWLITLRLEFGADLEHGSLPPAMGLARDGGSATPGSR